MEAMEFYTSTFPESKIEGVLKYKDGGENGEDPENVQHAQFVINNYMLSCMDSSLDHKFDFNEGISLVIMTNDRERNRSSLEYINIRRRERKHVWLVERPVWCKLANRT